MTIESFLTSGDSCQNSSQYFLSMISCLLLLVASLAYTTNAISVPSGINIASDPTLSNLTSLHLPAQSDNSVAEDDFWIWYCTNNQRWSRPEIKPEDCKGMLDFFWLETYDKGHRKSRTFRAPGGNKISSATQEWTPRKYTFGTCTLAIVMVSDFPNRTDLPGGYKTGPPSDTSTYYNLWKVATNLVERCVDRGELGWQATGPRYGIGVFIWSTGSEEDELIEADEPRFTFPTSEAPANGSTASD